ncbi:MAG: M14 family zinc carboxypeptidase [Phycisphaerales bacterium]|nr:M14 family zinc carboxypeptidase [Phycisphaerales bacterium]
MKYSTLAAVGLMSVFSIGAVAQTEGYLSNLALEDAMNSLASSSKHASVSTIGSSLEGNPIQLVTLAGSADTAQSKPALLITAGLDGRYLAGTEVAVRIARQVLSDHVELLDSMTLYIVPRVNPDGAARNLDRLTMGFVGNSRSIDDDRDRITDEDSAEDINGDGLITMMRRLNSPIEDPATHLADPDDPRLNIKPDPKENQRASFTLYTEGVDNDSDGQINEDGFGSIDLDQNFMHRWPEYDTYSGKYPLSEPESNAIAQFVINNDHIVMALTLGRHDNLINQPDTKSKDNSGAAPKAIDAKDADVYKLAGELYKDATGFSSAPTEDIAGSFHAWLYAQRGIPSFAVIPWLRPESEKADVDQSDASENAEPEAEIVDSGLTPSGVGDISQETLDELMEAYVAATGEEVDESMISMITPEMVEGFAAQAGIKIRRITVADPETEVSSSDHAGKKKPKKKKLSDDAKWLTYFDEQGIDGFVDWKPFSHPTLGDVEIGGFVPLARINPPADQLDTTSEKLTDFVVELMSTRPSVSIVGPEIKQLGSGLYEVRLSLVNDGKLPTTTAYSQSKRTIRPIVVRLSTDLDQIVTGQRVGRVWGIDPNGGRSDHRWIIRSDDMSSETIEIIDPRLGNHKIKLGDTE